MTTTGGRGSGGGSNRDKQRRGRLPRALAFMVAAALSVVATACASSSSTSAAAGATTSTGSSGAAVVKVTTVATYGRILTDSGGRPLYTLRGSCTGSCASAWPPLSAPGGVTPAAVAGAPGTLGTVKLADGTDQVIYDGSPLYTFVQDSPGRVTGQGVAGFSVVTVSGSPAGGGGGVAAGY